LFSLAVVFVYMTTQYLMVGVCSEGRHSSRWPGIQKRGKRSQKTNFSFNGLSPNDLTFFPWAPKIPPSLSSALGLDQAFNIKTFGVIQDPNWCTYLFCKLLFFTYKYDLFNIPRTFMSDNTFCMILLF
jgi:hypothetical protein